MLGHKHFLYSDKNLDIMLHVENQYSDKLPTG